jgi:hypothetical protein
VSFALAVLLKLLVIDTIELQGSLITGEGTITGALQVPATASTEDGLAGQVITVTGMSSLLMVTVKLQEAEFPEASVTVYVTVVAPTLNTCVAGMIPLPLSVVTPES